MLDFFPSRTQVTLWIYSLITRGVHLDEFQRVKGKKEEGKKEQSTDLSTSLVWELKVTNLRNTGRDIYIFMSREANIFICINKQRYYCPFDYILESKTNDNVDHSSTWIFKYLWII